VKPRLTKETISIDGVLLDVSFYFYPGRPGNTYGPPEFCYEGEPPEIDIESITSNDDIFGLLADSKNVIERIEVYIIKNAGMKPDTQFELVKI
jgi:hypothetical protein